MKYLARVLMMGCVALLASCLSYFFEKPTFSLKEIAITRLSLTEINFLLGIEVRNPNNFDLKLRSLKYAVYLNDRQVGNGRLENEILISKAAPTLVQVPLSTDFKQLGNPVDLFLSGKDLHYKIEGAAIVKTTLGTTTVPFSKEGEIKIKR